MTLSKFFQDYYIIPDYQRGYSWQDKQIEDFWEDITSAIEKEVNHYFGTVYLKSIQDGVYEVIDGQQRLTTLFVLLKILGIDELIKNGPVYHLDYSDNPNRDFFINKIIEGIGQERIINCYRKNLCNLKKNLLERLESYGEENLQNLKEFLSKKLIIDVRYIGNEDGITDMVVFETLNNRGKPLSILEKLKNRLMYLNSINGFELKDKINQVWAKIYNELGTINEKYINKNISIDDDFVSAHLTIYRRSENTTFSIKGTEEKLFQMFCQNPEKFPINERSNLEEWNKFSDEEKDSKGREENLTKDKIQNYINSLQKFCSAWVKIINFCEIKDENIKKCLMLDSSKELKILLTTLCMKKNTDEVLGELSKVLFRQNLPTEWNRTWDFATLAYYFNNQDKSILYEGENYTIDLIFLNTEFKTIIEEKLDLKSISDGFKNYYTSGKGAAGFYKWKSIKYFLYEYDKQLRGRRNCCDIPYEDIEVEHIIPQNPNYWPDFQINNRISRNVMINTLGNLTILDNSKNSRISNSNWENKKVAYSTDSTRSEKEILEISNNDNWNLSCIRRRGEKMFKYLIEIITQYGNGDGGNNWKQYDFDPVKTKILYYDGNRKRRYDS